MSLFCKSNIFISLEEGVKTTYEKMVYHEQRAEYQDAQRCRIEWEHRKEELKNKQSQEIESRHRKQKNQIMNDMKDQLERLDLFWNSKINDFQQKSEQAVTNLLAKHNQQCIKLEEELGLQLSTKLKESSELLNLRKMQEQMAKQKNYVEAHRVQDKIKKLFAQEEKAWLQKRSQKIGQALLNLRNKQAAQLANMRHRIKVSNEQSTKDHHFQGLRIRQRYQNCMKDLKAEQQRQMISFKGEFRTLGGGSPQSSPNRSKISGIDNKMIC